jgi:hypothetical protein
MFNQQFFNYTPLEQFDDVSWVYYDFLLEGIASYSKYVFELEYDIFSLTNLNGSLVVSSLSSSSTLIVVLAVFIIIKTAGYINYISEFSHLFLLGFIHLFTGSIIFLW